MVKPGGDSHQRRLASAILTHQGVDLAAEDVEIDVAICDHGPETLRDSEESQCWRSAVPADWLRTAPRERNAVRSGQSRFRLTFVIRW
jgi:hypothetical protein